MNDRAGGGTVPLLEAEGIRKRYGGEGDSPSVEVLRRVDLVLRPGETVAVTGPSGSGKSTLLSILGTLERPDGGTLRLEGEELLALAEGPLLRVRNRKVGFVFQLHHLLPQCTVLENALVPALAAPRGEREAARERALRLLDRVSLGHRLHHRPGALSGGERQRAALVRALVNRPRLLLADEPTGSLDRAAAGELVALLRELNREEGTALVVASHSARVVSAMGRVLELRDGELLPAGAP